MRKRRADADSLAGSDEQRVAESIPRRKVVRERVLTIGEWTGTTRELVERGGALVEGICEGIRSVSDVKLLIPYYPELARYGQGCRILARMAHVSRNSMETRMMDNLREMYASSLVRSFEGLRMVEAALDADISYNNMQMIVIRLLESIESKDLHILRAISSRFCTYLTQRGQPERRGRMIRVVGARVFDLLRDSVLCDLLITHLLEAYGEEFYHVVAKLMEIRRGNCPELLALLVDKDKEVATSAYHVLLHTLLGMRRTWIPYHRQVVDILRPYLQGVRGLAELL